MTRFSIYSFLLSACLLLAHPGIAQDTTNEGPWEDLLEEGNLETIWTSVSGPDFPSQGWYLDQGTLILEPGRKGGDIITRKAYDNFELRWEFNLSDSANTGIKYLVTQLHDSKDRLVWNGPEYQLIDDEKNPTVSDGKSPQTSTASLYLLYAPEGKVLHGPRTWNRARIVVRGAKVEHWLNGTCVLRYTRGTPDFRERVAQTKFKQYDHYGEAKEGRIMLTDHHDKAAFRNMKIRRLNP